MTTLPSTPTSFRQTARRVLLWMWGHIPFPNFLRELFLWVIVDKFLVGVGMVIFNERSEVLLCRHTYRLDCPWGLPGGWLEHHEDPSAAAEREVLEETGLIVQTLRPVASMREKGYNHIHLIFMGRLVGGTFRPSDEVSEVRFFPLDQLPDLLPGTPRLIDCARDMTLFVPEN